jgi:hypothetical protein
MTTTLSPPATACPRCGSTERQIREQTFKDGTTHNREECSSCRHFFRYAPRRESQRQSLPVAPPPPQQAPSPPSSPAELANAIQWERESIAWFHENLHEIQRRLAAGQWEGRPLDIAIIAIITATAQTAAVYLDLKRITRQSERCSRSSDRLDSDGAFTL